MGIGSRIRSKRRLRVLFFVLAAAVGVLSLLPQTAPPGGGVDLVLHALTYGGLMGLFGVAFHQVWVGAAGLFLYSSLIRHSPDGIRIGANRRRPPPPMEEILLCGHPTAPI